MGGQTEDFVEAVKAAGGADVVLDMVAGEFTQRNLESLKPKGRLVTIATQVFSPAVLQASKLIFLFGVSTGRQRSNNRCVKHCVYNNIPQPPTVPPNISNIAQFLFF